MTWDRPIRRGDDPVHEDVVSRLMGLKPLKDPLPEDMPALEKLRIYARDGFAHFYRGTEQEFERVWSEATGKAGRNDRSGEG